jgi:hypothetical protein
MLEEHNAIDVKCPGRNDFNERIIKFKKPLWNLIIRIQKFGFETKYF